MSNSSILLLFFIITAAQILYSIKNDLYGYCSSGIQIVISALLVMAVLVLSLIMPIKFASKDRIDSPNFANYEGVTYLITGKSARGEGLATIKVNNTNITVDKVTFKSFFGCELVDYEINYN